jgi:hypothetical protein
VRCKRRRRRSSELLVYNFALHDVYTFYLYVYMSTCYTGAYFWLKICIRVAFRHANM